jgi:hypothetical protein
MRMREVKAKLISTVIDTNGILPQLCQRHLGGRSWQELQRGTTKDGHYGKT